MSLVPSGVGLRANLDERVLETLPTAAGKSEECRGIEVPKDAKGTFDNDDRTSVLKGGCCVWVIGCRG